MQTTVYTIHLELQHSVEEDFQLKVSSSGGKIDILLTKADCGKRWSNIGRTLEGNNKQIETSECKVIEFL